MKNKICITDRYSCVDCGVEYFEGNLPDGSFFSISTSLILSACPSHYCACVSGFITIEEMLKRSLIDLGMIDSSLRVVLKND